MTWEKKRVLITAKAAPETSAKYGECVCTAGVTDDGEFIRLYPITLDFFRRSGGFKKFDWIECMVEKSNEMLNRKESYRVDESTICIIDTSLSEPVKKKLDWKGRSEVLMGLRSQSIEDLVAAFDEDRTSLGLIKVSELLEFYKTQDLNEEEQFIHRKMQAVLDVEFGTDRMKVHEVLNQIPHIYRYKFRCGGESCNSHDMTCEDWELFAAHRNWTRNNGPRASWMIQDHFDRWMRERDLHFFMGTESRYGRWLIIGLYYPPKVE